MAKNISAPLARTARLLDLVPYLNTHQGISLKDLAQRFDVTTTQMSSDLTTLWMCGLPGYTPLELMDLEFESGYVTIRNAPTLSKPRSISFDEAVALLLGLDLLAGSIDSERTDLLEAIENLKSRISKLLGIPITFKATPKSSPTIEATLREVIKKNLFAIIKYHSLYRDEISERKIQPLEIVENSSHLYLRAFCFTAGAMRDFRMDRIIAADTLLERPQNFDTTTPPEKVEFAISLRKPSRDAVERFNIDYKVDEKVHTLTSYSQQWIERSVMATGDAVELSKPLNIRTSIAKKAQLILDRYKAN